MPAQEVKSYEVHYFGGIDGYQGIRSRIALYGGMNNILALICFYDAKPTQDFIQNNIIYMFLPPGASASVIDILRNEKPLYIDWRYDRGFLTTNKEFVGEGEGV